MNLTERSSPRITGREGTFPLMGLACLLIVNSHLERLYPKSFLAADGLIGNTIFFLLAGYGVTLSQTLRPYAFTKFYVRRLLRICPSVVLVVIIGALIGFISLPSGLGNVLSFIVWPTQFPFIERILVFYPIAWVLGRLSLKRGFYILAGAIGVWLATGIFAHIHLDPSDLRLGAISEAIWWGYHLCVFVAGALIGKQIAETKGGATTTSPYAVLITTALLFGTYVALKFAYYRSSFASPVMVAMILQILGLSVSVGLFYLQHFFLLLSERLHLDLALLWIGKSSLQIYLSHLWFEEICASLGVHWSVKVLSFFAFALMTGWLLRKLVETLELITRQLTTKLKFT